VRRKIARPSSLGSNQYTHNIYIYTHTHTHTASKLGDTSTGDTSTADTELILLLESLLLLLLLCCLGRLTIGPARTHNVRFEILLLEIFSTGDTALILLLGHGCLRRLTIGPTRRAGHGRAREKMHAPSVNVKINKRNMACKV